MLPIPVPFIAENMVRIYSAIYLFFMETLWGNFSYCAQDTPSQMGCVIKS